MVKSTLPSLLSALLLAIALLAHANPVPQQQQPQPPPLQQVDTLKHLKILPGGGGGGGGGGGRGGGGSSSGGGGGGKSSSSSSSSGGKSGGGGSSAKPVPASGTSYKGSGTGSISGVPRLPYNPGATYSSSGFYPPRSFTPYSSPYYGPRGSGSSPVAVPFAAGALIGAGGVSHGYRYGSDGRPNATDNSPVNVFENASYADVVQIGAHYSFATYGSSTVRQSSIPGGFQDKSVKQQLDDGVRLLHIEGHPPFGGGNATATSSAISLCVPDCGVKDYGPVEDYLRQVSDWLNANPMDVVTLLVGNPENLEASRWNTAFEQSFGGGNATNLSARVFVPSKAALTRPEWPTYGDLIRNGTRLVVFLDAGSDTSRYPYLIDSSRNVWENARGQTALPFNCTADRGVPAGDKLGLLNQYLYGSTPDGWLGGGLEPDSSSMPEVNSGEFNDHGDGIRSTFGRCANTTSQGRATFILVDRYTSPSAKGPVYAGAVLNNISDSTLATEYQAYGSGASGLVAPTQAKMVATLIAAVVVVVVSLVTVV